MENKAHDLSSFTHYFRMVGNSMNGGGKRGFINGDILCCDIVDFKDIQVDECYVIKQQSGVVVMKTVEFDGKCIIARPLNLTYSRREFVKDEVQFVYLIKACQRKVAEDVDL